MEASNVVNILVTGGAGFIGSHVVDALLAAGHTVSVVDDLSTGKRQQAPPAATFYQVDIRSPELANVLERERPEVVIHHAAQISVAASVADPVTDASINVVGSVNLIELARRAGVRKVVYGATGGAAYGNPLYLPADEEHPVQPLAPYGASKHAVEHYLHLYRENFGLDYTSLRYSNVYGPRQDPHGEAGVTAIFAQRMLAGQEVVIHGSGDQERDFVYVGDVARANLLALGAGGGRIYHVASGTSVSINAIFELLSRLCAYHRPPRHGPAKAGEPFRVSLDASRAERELGWRPEVPLEEGLRRTVEYFRA